MLGRSHFGLRLTAKVIADPRREAEFDRAFELLQQLVD